MQGGHWQQARQVGSDHEEYAAGKFKFLIPKRYKDSDYRFHNENIPRQRLVVITAMSVTVLSRTPSTSCELTMIVSNHCQNLIWFDMIWLCTSGGTSPVPIGFNCTWNHNWPTVTRDHINGKKHQRNLGMSMRVERSTLDQVIFLIIVVAVTVFNWLL